MEDNLDFFPVKPSEMERNNFREQNGNLQLASSLRSSSSLPGFFYFTRTNDVLSFAACCNRRSSARVSWHWSDRIKTSQKEAFPLVEVELKRPDRNCSLFQALGQWSATRRKRARKTIRKKRGRGGEEGTPSSLAPTPTPHPRCFFFLLTSLCAVPTI